MVEAHSPWLDGSAVDEERCRARVAEGPAHNGGSVQPEWLLRFMGFTQADLGQGDWIQFFYTARNEPEIRRRAKLLPDFSRPGRPVVAGVAAQDLGCGADDTQAWYCFAHRCLGSADEAFRSACLEVAFYLQTKQREQALGRGFGPSKRVRSLLARYPSLDVAKARASP